MYSENNRRASVHRANDDFLRRMLGGNLTGGERAVMSENHHGEISHDSLDARSQSEGRANEFTPNPNSGMRQDAPPCNDGDRDEKGCSKYLHAPSLAMVYAPRQCWQNLLDPEVALENGTQFAELVLPFEGGKQCARTEGRGKC